MKIIIAISLASRQLDLYEWQTDDKATVGLALKFYAKIANSIVLEINNNNSKFQNNAKDYIDTISLINSEAILNSYHAVDYSR
jgi:hypothetical protein